MKKSEAIKDSDQLPKVFDENWIKQAIKKFDKSPMTPDQRFQYEITMARNASIAEMEREKEERIRQEAKEEMAKKLKDLGTEIQIIIENYRFVEARN